jgi:hypothetical protein
METVKTSLTLEEILFLEAEIGGVANETGIVSKGLLQHKLSISTKYYLTKLLTTLQEDKKYIGEQRNELIKSLGTETEEGSFEIKNEIDGQVNPNIVEFRKQMDELMRTEREIEHVKLSIDDFKNIETEANFQVLFKLFG